MDTLLSLEYDLQQQALGTAKAALEGYLLHADERLLSLVTDDLLLAGIGDGEWACGKEALAALLRNSAPRPACIHWGRVELRPSGAGYRVLCDLQLLFEHAPHTRCLRATLLLEPVEDRLLVSLMQLAAPNLDRPDRLMEEMSGYIPGSICSCKLDKIGSFDLLTADFAETFGCTRSEIAHYYHNCLQGLIYGPDHAQVEREMRQHLKIGTPLSIEHRVRLKTGETRWFRAIMHAVQMPDHSLRLFLLYTDIDDQKRAQERVALNEARYNMIMELSDSIIYEWDLASDEVEFSPIYEKRFGYPPPTGQFLQGIKIRGHLHPDDQEDYCRALRAILHGSAYEELVVRVKTKVHGYVWCKVVLGTIFDERRQPVRALGILVDVDEQMRQTQEYRSRMMRDPLTGLYNKAATESLITSILQHEQKGSHAFLIFDLDNFKQVNDQYGHHIGDLVIQCCAKRIQSLFRANDVVGRIGGDEFVAFMRDFKSYRTIIKKIQSLGVTFQEPLLCDGIQVPVTYCIGLSIYPQHGDSFEELYKKGDAALYTAKRQGKNQHICYHEGIPLTPREQEST